MLVRIVKGWVGPDFFYQTPGERGIWDGIKFTFDPVEECDFLIVLNNQLKNDVTVNCYPEHVWALMQEPYVKGHSDWMAEKHEAFDRVFTHHIPSVDAKYVVSHPADPWHVQRTFDQLILSPLSEKKKAISWIAGDPTDLPGHIKRLTFLTYVRQNASVDIDYFGKAIRYIKDKWEGLAPYRYTIIIQNSSSRDYWTDVVADSFLSGTVPIYYGCPNLETYFPEESFIRINIDEPGASLERIERVVREDNWEKRLPALEEARRLVLHRYQFFPHMSGHIREQKAPGGRKTRVTIPAYRRSGDAKVYRVLFKVRREIRRMIHRWK